MGPIRSIGFKGYRNTQDLVTEFYESQISDIKYPSLSKEEKLFETDEQFGIFYLKSPSNSDAVHMITEEISLFTEQNIIDDPVENPPDALLWYSRHLKGCTAFFAHFMSSEQINYIFHNNKTALIAGMAYGLGKKMFLLAPEPFIIPSDLPDFVKLHTTASQAKKFAKSFISELLQEAKNIQKKAEAYSENKINLRTLQGMRLGEYLAENENEMLINYFIETGAYNEVINGQQTIFVGRKGTGKTANLYAAEKYFKQHRKNLVVTIKPVGYEVEGLIEILEHAGSADARGFFIESLWKYLLYTEITRVIVQRIEELPDNNVNACEKTLIDFVNQYSETILDSFAERLRRVVGNIKLHEFLQSGVGDMREHIASKLHAGILKLIRRNLSGVMAEYENIVVLIDNLDKGWVSGVNTQKVSEILFGLLSVSRILPDEIKNDIKSSIKPNFRITIFLRSDIYSFVKKIAREKDKLEVGRIEWNDKEVLGRVLDERIMMNMDNKLPEQIWSEFFESNVDSKSPKQFILSMTRPRPRDSIFFLKAAISKAISRGHGKVTVEDMFSASEEYSRWAYDSLIDEDYPEKRHMENLLYEFVNDKYIYEETELDQILLGVIGNIEDAENIRLYF